MIHSHLRALLFGLTCTAAGAACTTQADSRDARSSAAAAVEVAATTNKQRPDPAAPVLASEEPPLPSRAPLANAKLFVDPESLAMLKANAIRTSDPHAAGLLDRIAKEPQAVWLGEWNTDIFRATTHLVERAKAEGGMPVMILYNVPHRDCGQHSRGGLSSKEAYQRWVRDIAAGIGEDSAVVVLEPDALGHIQECLTEQQKQERFALIRDAVWTLRQNANTVVYVDAGHARWVPAADMAERLEAAGIRHAHGFALNTSNYVSTEENLQYGRALSALVGGAHFVIDTSRNGNGAAPKDEWCNPSGRRIGQPPTAKTADPLCDAYLWLKRPGESDGECNGGPKAGVFWLEKALELAGQ